MTRIDDDSLSLHLEVALSGAAPYLLEGLAASDRRRRHAAVAEMARQLTERLRCFDIRSEDAAFAIGPHPTLFPEDIGPMG